MATADAHGIASERDLVISQLEDEVYRLTALLNASALIAGSLDPDTVLKELVRQAALVLRARASSLLLVDDEANELVFRVVYGEKGTDLLERRLPLDRGIAGAVATTGEPILLANAREDPRHFAQFDEELGFTTGSLLAVPVQVRGRVLGVLEVLNPDTEARFTEDDLTLLIAFAGQTGVALSNAERHSGMQRQLAHVAASMQDGLVLLNGQGRVRLVNAAAREMLGLDPAAPITAADLAGAVGDPAALGPVKEVSTHEVGVEVPDHRPRTVQVNAAPMLNEAGRQIGTVLVLHNTSRRHELERLKNRVIATISHELRTPVASIQGGAQLLSDGTVAPDSTDGRKFVEIIQRNAERLAKLVASIVDLAELGGGNLQMTAGACSLAPIIANVAQQVQPAVTEAGQSLELNVADALPDVWADARRVEQVLLHLLDNARKFTPAGGAITVQATADAEWATIRVCDTGPGIAPAARNRAFEIFDQLSDPQRDKAAGTGVGLPIARGIVEALGGRIWIEAEPPGGGTEIVFRLPCAAPDPA